MVNLDISRLSDLCASDVLNDTITYGIMAVHTQKVNHTIKKQLGFVTLLCVSSCPSLGKLKNDELVQRSEVLHFCFYLASNMLNLSII